MTTKLLLHTAGLLVLLAMCRCLPTSPPPSTTTPPPARSTVWPTQLPPVTDSIGPGDCDFVKLAKCQQLVMNSSRELYSKPSSVKEYSTKVCSSMKAAGECLQQLNGTCSPHLALASQLAMHKSFCERENNCRMVDTASYCMAQYGPLDFASLPTYNNTCSNVDALDRCVADRFMASGCVDQTSRARLLWKSQRMFLEQTCYIHKVGLNNTCLSTHNACEFNALPSLMEGIATQNLTAVCHYATTAIQCFQQRMPTIPKDHNCDAARQYLANSIALSTEMSAVCQMCISYGNVYSPMPNTSCSKFSQEVKGSGIRVARSCPDGLVFDVKTCVCNFPASVTCGV